MNRDIALWFALDMEPFNMVQKRGFKLFFEKNLPKMALPTSETLGGTALRDVYDNVRSAVAADISKACSLSLMFDGWTDRYRANSYLGLRASYITEDWQARLVTLCCKPLNSHTGEAVANFVRDELSGIVDIKTIPIFSTHDGAAAMMKASRLLRVNNVQHCVAHALNLLVMGGLDVVDEIHTTIEKCKKIVNTLHFKGHIIETELAYMQDRKFIEAMMMKMSSVHEVSALDDQFPVQQVLHPEGTDKLLEVPARSKHETLKKHCVTRWNSVLMMMESLLDLKEPVQESLKRTGNLELTLASDEWELLTELQNFLKVFKDLTDLVSSNTAGLSLIPLIRDEINDAVKVKAKDSESLKDLKENLAQNVNRRLPLSECTNLCSLLDPGTKDAVGIPKEEQVKMLEDAFLKIEQPESESSESVGSSDTNTCNMMESNQDAEDRPTLSKKRRILQKKRTSTGNDAKDEIERFLACKPSGEEEDNPLIFWRAKAELFPRMAKLARIYLCISAGSVPVECMFSVSGLILNGKRSSLAPYKVNYLSYIHDNYPVFCSRS